MPGAETEEQPKTIVRPTSLLDSCRSFFPSLSDLAFLIPILVLFWCTTGVGWLLTDSDTGWHIRAGEWILKNGRVPTTDVFSFAMAGKPWFAWEWLSDVSMATVHRSGGLAGIVLVSLLLLGATSVCVYKSTVAESGRRLIAIVVTSLAMAASTIHWLARPHLVTPLMASAFCWVLNHVERKSKPILPLAFPLTILWVNLHGGFFIGIVLLITYGTGAAAEELVHGTRHIAWVRGRKYFLVAGACAMASLLNPYGYRLHVHVARYLGVSFYLQHVSEFQSIDFHSFTAAYFETLMVFAIAAAVWHLGSGRLIHVTLLLSWFHLALFSARNIPIFAVVTAPSIGLAVHEWLEYAGSRWPELWMGKLAARLEDLERGLRTIVKAGKRRQWHLVPCFVVLVLALLLAHPGRVRTLRAEFDRTRFPSDAADFLLQRGASRQTRLYSSWQWGGYLIYRLWPSIAVFNEGRTDFYGPAFVEEGLRTWEVAPDWNNILVRYGVNAALLPVDSALASVLRERGDWKPVYQDEVAVLFEKRADVR